MAMAHFCIGGTYHRFFYGEGMVAAVHRNTELTLKHLQNGLKPETIAPPTTQKKICDLKTLPKIVQIVHQPASTLNAIIRLVKNIESNLYHGQSY